MPAQAVAKGKHLMIAPHPHVKARKRLAATGSCCALPHVIVDEGDVGPLAFDSDDVEAIALDQQLGDLGSGGIEFVRSMGCLAQRRGCGACRG